MSPSPSDLFLSRDFKDEEAARYLQALGFRDPASAQRNLRAMADDVAVRAALARTADRLLDAFLKSPNPDAALLGFSRYLAARGSKVSLLEYIGDDPLALQVLADVLGSSPFLTEILIRNPEYFHGLMSSIDLAEDRRPKEDWWTAPGSDSSPASALNAIKRVKRREILRIAARDILGRETLSSATAELADLADRLIDRALVIVSSQLLSRERRAQPPGQFAVIGMGKLGGRELNYSSDVDLVYVYRPDEEEDRGAHEFFHRLARALTAAVGEYTDESYLYRVDLRLRPMGSRGAIAYSLEEYRRYYEAWGETFERFALIKARPVAGDRNLGGRFIESVQPFVYRKYLDHAALEEIFRYKERADRLLDRNGHDRNVKIGRGGIREVEIFTQVLQLTYGGQEPSLRVSNTLAALDRLLATRIIDDRLWTDLTRGYAFLRTVEHRLQIVHERQTHSLSQEALELEITARRLGLASAAAMEAELAAHRRRVHEVYSGLLERRSGTTNFEGRRFFSVLSDDSDLEAQAYLEEIGFHDPASALRAVRALEQHASLTHTRSTARNVLANLLGIWAPSIARTTRPEATINRFERLTAGAGAAMLLFRSLLEDGALRETLLTVLDSGELMSERIIRHPELLDSLAGPLVDVESLNRTFAASLTSLRPTERMNKVRRFKLMTEFKILVEWLNGSALDAVQEKLSRLADCSIEHAAHWGTVAVPVAGRTDAVEWAIVALGKLGGSELSVHSDLDLVVLYDGDPADSATFVRFQAFVEAVQTFLDAPTSEGVAYRIDTRLRPEGTKGALATPFAAFRAYVDRRAESWERLAWTRFRVVVGTPRISEALHASVARFVYDAWTPDVLRSMRHIRARMERELAHESATQIDFKVGRGGLADIDFLLELVQVREGASKAEFRIAGTRALLASMPPTKYVRPEEIADLRAAYTFLRELEFRTRMNADSNVSWIRPEDNLFEASREITERVRSLYETVLARLEAPF